MGIFYDEYNKAKTEFQQLSDEIGDSDKVIETIHRNAFALLRENQLMEYLVLVQESKNQAFLEVKTASEAQLILKKLSSFAENRKRLVNTATEIYLFCEKTKKLNEFVRENVFLGKELIRSEYPEAFRDAKTYLENAPLFSKYYTNEAIRCIWQSFISGLPKHELIKLIEEINPPVDLISQLDFSGDQGYRNNLLFIRERLGLPVMSAETFDTKLKGVTFPNEDGSSRQEYLKQLQAAFKKSPQEITIERWEYEGAPAAKVFWGEKEIGAVPADIMKELTEKHGDFELTAEIVKVNGGDDFNYGCEIKLHVFGEQKSNIKISEFFKKKQAEETKEELTENKEEDKPDDKAEPDDAVEELDFT